jgi:hypothetical protein
MTAKAPLPPAWKPAPQHPLPRLPQRPAVVNLPTTQRPDPAVRLMPRWRSPGTRTQWEARTFNSTVPPAALLSAPSPQLEPHRPLPLPRRHRELPCNRIRNRKKVCQWNTVAEITAGGESERLKSTVFPKLSNYENEKELF